VPGHHDLHPCRDRRPERYERPRLEIVPAELDDTELMVRVLGNLAVTREVFRGRRHARRLQAADERDTLPGHERGIVAEGAGPEGGVRRLAREVEDRRIDDVDAHRPRFAPDRRTDGLGEGDVVDRPERHVPGELGRLRAETDQLAAFLVRGHEERARVSG
jgi:hypothetical protein